jgi:ADP-ribosylation factor GTPase-activating protein 2/3
VTSRLVQPRKPSGKLGGGLGVKKLETKVDDTLFEQAPAAPEPVKQAAPVEAAAADARGAAQASGASTSSRFAYDALNAAPSPGAAGAAAAGAAAARGKDGHLTLGLSNDDFFRDPLSAKGLGGSRPGSGQYGGQYGGMGGPAAGMRGADAEPVAQKKFGNAKAISSK